MKKYIALACILFIVSVSAFAQVGDIKSASSSNKSSGRSDRGSSGNASLIYMFVDFSVRTIVPWQINTLQKRGEVPNVLSLEVFGQASIQPSTYYVFNPRVRGNWGIFLTDFRTNYMLEEKIGKWNDLRTDDWQILGLNIVNTRRVTARISTGIMHEAFSGGNTFSESAAGISVMTDNQRSGVTGEFRWARDYTTNRTPRIEGSIFYQQKLFDHGVIHMFATGGVQFQRYYNEINVWGIQGGLIFKLYRVN
ncbi:MAG: hypothetical protein WDO14_23720 [Bacteroidota bacterium]